jgi:endonuclease III-like uncharacterized protein
MARNLVIGEWLFGVIEKGKTANSICNSGFYLAKYQNLLTLFSLISMTFNIRESCHQSMSRPRHSKFNIFEEGK